MRSEPVGVARATGFEQLSGVFAGCGALHYAKILVSLKIKNGIFLTPLNCALNAFTFALNDSFSIAAGKSTRHSEGCIPTSLRGRER